MGVNDILIGGGRIFYNDGGMDGAAGAGYLDMGNIPALAIQKAITEIQHYGFNAIAKARQKDLNLITDIGISLQFTVDELFADSWAILLLSTAPTPQVYAGGSITDEPVNAPATLDRSIFTLQRNITNLKVTGAAETPVFVLGDDYTIENPVTGEIKILSTGSITASLPLLLDYDAAAETRQQIVPGADASVKGSARLEFTAQNGSDLTWIIQNCEIKPDGDSPLSSTEASEVGVVLNILVDKVVDSAQPFGVVYQG